MLLLTMMSVKAQVNIHGNVYGGARQASVGGSTNVTVAAQTFDVIINGVFGGCDISGNIGYEKGETDTTPDATVKTEKESSGKHFFIGQVFGGGNGDYDYPAAPQTADDYDGKYTGKYIATKTVNNVTTVEAASDDPFLKPEIGTVALDIQGGTFGYVFGGGNKATVKESTHISINIPDDSERTKIASEGEGGCEKLTRERLLEMGINTEYYNKLETKYRFSRVFGGNNKADMAIRPTWDLQKGTIENLYSGGNEGRMTNPQGLLLEIGKKGPNNTTITSDITVYNVYGGCRKADVRPMELKKNEETQEEEYVDVEEVKNISGYNFPAGLSARTLIRSGHITNVYGGNDVRGRVYGGNAIGVYTSIKGDIYGGGNGSYAYTDNSDFENDLLYGDFYYNPNTVFTEAGETTTSTNGLKSAEALNLIRPNAEQVSIRVWGQSESQKTIILGSIYCGGNSATLKSNKAKPVVELKIGSYVIADNVYLGNNGEQMVDKTDGGVLSMYASSEVKDAEYDENGTAEEKAAHVHDFSTMVLTNEDQFATYMDGCAMNLIPSISFDNEVTGDPDTYKPFTSYIGSFFCGGNRGSMTYPGINEMDFDVPVYIYNKVVGGCNNAYVEAVTNLNAAYFGGIRGAANERGDNYYTVDGSATGQIKDRLILNFTGTDEMPGTQIMPMRWKKTGNDYVLDDDRQPQLELNTIDGNGDPVPPITAAEPGVTYPITSSDDDLARRLDGGHVYGGCYNSGHVNGNVIINLNSELVDRNILFDKVAEDADGEVNYTSNYYTDEAYTILERHSGVILGQQGMDVFGSALNVFGGGYGPKSEVWGSATINLSAGYTFQIFGGGEQGAIGKGWNPSSKTFSYSYDPRYSTTINLHGERAGVTKQADRSQFMAECEFIYVAVSKV